MNKIMHLVMGSTFRGQGQVLTLTENQSTYIPLGEVHRLANPGTIPLEIIEVQSGNHAFGPLKLHKVCGQAVGSNQASIAFHQRLGFVLEGVLRDQRRIEGAYHSLHCFGLLAREWQPEKIIKA